MAWSDKPTDNQIWALMREYDAILYDIVEANEDKLDARFTEQAARQIPTRKEVSDEIGHACHGEIHHPAAREWLEKYFKEKGVEAKF